MKDSLINLVNSTIILEYQLPHDSLKIEKSCITDVHLSDDCYKVEDCVSLNRIIYESILYYSYDDHQLLGGNHQKMFINAFNKKFKYNDSADGIAKRKLGIYGESLLYAILKTFYKTKTLVCRGYFYDIQKKSEVTGYDCFHLIEKDNSLELWFGETKFYEDGKAAIDSVFKSITKALSDDYLVNTNFTTIMQSRGNIDETSLIYPILEKWEKCIIDSLEEELKINNIKLVYPVLITFNKKDGYDDSITSIIKYINDKYNHLTFDNITLEYSIFFILLPIDDVKNCKESIIKWIDNKEPLML